MKAIQFSMSLPLLRRKIRSSKFKSPLHLRKVMGNKIMSNRAFVDEKYTRPQGVYDPKDGDFRKLRHLILNGQLAPCFPGTEECTSELDECPICFLFYPSLNRSRCCSKAICTECYLQIKLARFARSSQCPFCKTSNYMVEFRGAKTVEEKGFEQAEEQKVIEAKIRIRQKELHDELQRVRRQGEDAEAESFEHETNCMSMEPGVSSQAVQVQESVHELNKNDGIDLDIEDMMLMEAIWLSIQEQGQRHQEFALAQGVPTISALSEEGFLDNNQISTEITGRTVGFTRPIAALGERQVTSAENRRGKAGEFTLDLRSDQSSAVEAGTSFSSNIPSASELPWEAPEFHSSGSSDNFGETSSLTASASMLPVSFDDQIMLAMALSLADAQAQASRQ